MVLRDYLTNELNDDLDNINFRGLSLEKIKELHRESVKACQKNFIKFLKKKTFIERHNKFVEEYFNGHEIQQVCKTKEHYNVFFIHKDELYEFQPTEKKLAKKNYEGVNFLNVTEFICQELMKRNTNFKYEEDFSLFSIDEDPQLALNKQWNSFVPSEEFLKLYFRQFGKLFH